MLTGLMKLAVVDGVTYVSF